MRVKRIAMAGAAGLTAAALLGVSAGAANAATTEPCPGTGPAASLSAEKHDAFLKEMTALKKERDAIRATYGKAAAGKGQRAKKARTRKAKRLTTAQRTAMRAELAAWRAERDALFVKYGVTPPGTGGPRA